MKELVIYAYEGILIGGEVKLQDCVRKAIKVGAEIAPEKTRVVTDRFKFLGVIIDIKEEKIYSETG